MPPSHSAAQIRSWADRNKVDRNHGGLNTIHLIDRDGGDNPTNDPTDGPINYPTNDPKNGYDPDTLVERLPPADSPDLTRKDVLEAWEATLRERERRLDYQEALHT